VKTTSAKYLRLHHADPHTTDAVAQPTDEMTAFWQTFTDTTGWRLDQRSRAIGAPKLLPAHAPSSPLDPLPSQPALPKDAARQLAANAARLIVRLRESEQAVRRQEAELAMRSMPLSSVDEQAELADRLDDLLQMAAEGTGGMAAALYLLDDDTTTLKMRAQFGLSEQRLTEPARPLRGALADLEAMISDVVAIEDCASPDEVYRSPEPMAAAICAVVCDGEVPIGTLWIWNDTAMEIDSRALAVARLAASTVAGEITRNRAARSAGEQREAKNVLRAVSQWQQRQLPPSMPLAEGWFADGLTYSSAPVAASWHTWDILPNGTIALAVAQAHSDALDATMIAATARAAFQAHSGYRLTPAQILQRVSDTLWQTNTGDQLVSLLYANLDPDTGEGMIASAGFAQAMVLSRYGFRPVSKVSEPLCSFPDYSPTESHLRLLPGEVLWAASRDMMETTPSSTSHWTQQGISAFVMHHIRQGAHEIVPAIHRTLAECSAVGDRTVAILCRNA